MFYISTKNIESSTYHQYHSLTYFLNKGTGYRNLCFYMETVRPIQCVENLLMNDDQEVPTPLHDRFQSTTHLFRIHNTVTYYTVLYNKDGENTTRFPSLFMFHTTFSLFVCPEPIYKLLAAHITALLDKFEVNRNPCASRACGITDANP